jgi:hypothetical protein
LDRRTVYVLTDISPNTGGRFRKITAKKQFVPRNIESFNPVTQELHRLLPAMIHTRTLQKNHNFGQTPKLAELETRSFLSAMTASNRNQKLMLVEELKVFTNYKIKNAGRT